MSGAHIFANFSYRYDIIADGLVYIFETDNLMYYVTGRVNIVLDYSPPYMQTGKNMTLKCNSQERSALEWSYITGRTNRSFIPVAPKLGGEFIIRYTEVTYKSYIKDAEKENY